MGIRSISEITQEGIQLFDIAIVHSRIERLKFPDRFAVVIEIQAYCRYENSDGHRNDEWNISFGRFPFVLFFWVQFLRGAFQLFCIRIDETLFVIIIFLFIDIFGSRFFTVLFLC